MWLSLSLPQGLSKRQVCCLILVFLAGCGGGGNSTPVVVQPPVLPPAVNVTPHTALLPIGTNQQFFAAVTHSSDKTVTWTASAGTVDPSGFYVAPASAPEGGVASVTAVLASDPKVSSSATITISTEPVSLTVSPTAKTVKAGFRTSFVPTVTGTSNLGVAWSLADPGDGTYPGTLAGGIYTAPAPIFSPHTYSIAATSTADPTKSASVQVTVVSLENQEIQAFPIELGASGVNATTLDCCSGTLGSLLADQKGKQYILSNSHVTGRMGSAAAGEAIVQPGFIDAACDHDIPKTVAKFTAAGGLSSNVDAAISEAVAGAVDPKGGIIGLGGAKSDGSYIAAPPATTLATPVVGMQVAKSGRTTGLSCGVVEALNGTVQVSVPAECGIPAASSIVYRGQIILDGLVRAGDSGSLIVEAATARPLGLVAGLSNDGLYTSANPASDVIKAMNSAIGGKLNFVGGAEHSVSCSAAAGTPRLQAGHPPSGSGTGILLSRHEVERAMTLQSKYEDDLLRMPGVLGVAIGRDEQRDGKAALLVFVDRAREAPSLPATLDGLSVRRIFTEKFGPAVLHDKGNLCHRSALGER